DKLVTGVQTCALPIWTATLICSSSYRRAQARAPKWICARRCLRGLGVAKDILVRNRQQVERLRDVPASLEAEVLSRGRVLSVERSEERRVGKEWWPRG